MRNFQEPQEGPATAGLESTARMRSTATLASEGKKSTFQAPQAVNKVALQGTICSTAVEEQKQSADKGS